MNRTWNRSSAGPGIRPTAPRASLRALPVAFLIHLAILIYGGVAAAQSVPLDYQAHERMKAEFSGRVVLLEVVQKAGQFEVQTLMPRRFGQGAPIIREGRAVIATSWFLVTGAESIVAVSPDGMVRMPVTVETELPEQGLAILNLPVEIAATLSKPPVAPGILTGPDPTRLYFCVSPVSPGSYVLTQMVVTDRAGPPVDALFMAPGVLAPGTALFDATGVPFAIAARESYSGNNFTIIAALLPAPVAGDNPVMEDADVREQ